MAKTTGGAGRRSGLDRPLPAGTRVVSGSQLWPADVVNYQGERYGVAERFPGSVVLISLGEWDKGRGSRSVMVNLKDERVTSAGDNISMAARQGRVPPAIVGPRDLSKLGSEA